MKNNVKLDSIYLIPENIGKTYLIERCVKEGFSIMVIIIDNSDYYNAPANSHIAYKILSSNVSEYDLNGIYEYPLDYWGDLINRHKDIYNITEI